AAAANENRLFGSPFSAAGADSGDDAGAGAATGASTTFSALGEDSDAGVTVPTATWSTGSWPTSSARCSRAGGTNGLTATVSGSRYRPGPSPCSGRTMAGTSMKSESLLKSGSTLDWGSRARALALPTAWTGLPAVPPPDRENFEALAGACAGMGLAGPGLALAALLVAGFPPDGAEAGTAPVGWGAG